MFDLFMLIIILLVLLFTWLDKFGGFFRDQVFMPLQTKIEGVFGGTLGFWLVVVLSFLGIIGLIFIFRKRLLKIGLVSKIWGITTN